MCDKAEATKKITLNTEDIVELLKKSKDKKECQKSQIVNRLT